MLTLSSLFISAQTFNNRLHLSSPSSLFSGVVVVEDEYYVLGSKINIDSTSFNTTDLIARFDNQGNMIEEYSVGEDSQIRLASFPTLIHTDDNNIFYTADVVDTTAKVSLIKMDVTGNVVWETSYDNYYSSQGMQFVAGLGMVQDEENNLYTVNNAQHPSQYNNVILTKIDSLGNVLWEKPFGSSSKMDVATDLIKCNDGTICIATVRYDEDHSLDYFEYQTRLIKTDTTGATIWTYTSPLEQGQIGFIGGIAEADDGGFVINALYGYEQNIVNPRYMEWEKYIYKISSTGELLWELEIPSAWLSGTTQAWRMIKTQDNSGYVMVGTDLLYDGGQGPQTSISERGWLAKIDDDGTLLWTRKYTGVNSLRNYQVLYDVKETLDGGFVAVGYSDDDTADTLTLQAWIIKTDEYGCIVPGCHITNTENPDLPQIKTSIYPNPVSDILNIWYSDPNFDYRNPPRFKVTDISGHIREEFITNINDTTLMLSVRDLPAGSYFLTCSTTQKSIPFMVLH